MSSPEVLETSAFWKVAYRIPQRPFDRVVSNQPEVTIESDGPQNFTFAAQHIVHWQCMPASGLLLDPFEFPE